MYGGVFAGKPDSYLFPTPKNEMKASMIVHLVRLNEQQRFVPPRFSLPFVEDLAFLIPAHNMGLCRLSLGGTCLHHVSNPFLRELDELRLLAILGKPLLACPIDLNGGWVWKVQGGFGCPEPVCSAKTGRGGYQY